MQNINTVKSTLTKLKPINTKVHVSHFSCHLKIAFIYHFSVQIKWLVRVHVAPSVGINTD